MSALTWGLLDPEGSTFLCGAGSLLWLCVARWCHPLMWCVLHGLLSPVLVVLCGWCALDFCICWVRNSACNVFRLFATAHVFRSYLFLSYRVFAYGYWVLSGCGGGFRVACYSRAVRSRIGGPWDVCVPQFFLHKEYVVCIPSYGQFRVHVQAVGMTHV